MLGSLQPFMPRDTYVLWRNPAQASPITPFNSNSNETTNEQHSNHHHQQQQQRRRRSSQHGPHHSSTTDTPRIPTALQLLNADETLLSRRKENIRRFGAGWLKPPGVPKTLQAGLDEAAERAEQEALARRDEGAREIREAQERMEHEQRMQQMGMDAQADPAMERDLDEEVPEAEELQWDGDLDGEGVDEAAFGDDLDGDGLGDAPDLDDDVPDASSYQHTDTDVEDESTEDDDNGLPTMRGMTVVQDMSSGFRWSLPGRDSFSDGLEDPEEVAVRHTLEGNFVISPPHVESSLIMSSPTGGRGLSQDTGRTVEQARRGRYRDA